MTSTKGFSVQAAHALVADCFTPSLPRYWLDFFGSWLVGVAAFVAVARGAPWAALWYVVAVLALYRAAVFIHEIVHIGRRSSMRWFGRAWNAVCGVPMLIPSFLYESHVEHHSPRTYGSYDDGEYLPFGRLPARRIVRFLAVTPVVPLVAVLRFSLIAPASWLVPALRPIVYRRASSLRIDIEHIGRMPRPHERRAWQLQEAACFFLCVVVAVLVATGVIELPALIAWYAVLVGVVLVNSIRLLGAHRYLCSDGGADYLEQLRDSINYPHQRLLAELWAPVGLRMHALHHLFPMIPYHNLVVAHQRLLAGLPEDSPYREAESSGLVVSLVLLWRRARASA